MARRDSSELIMEAVAYAMSAANYNASNRDTSHSYKTYIKDIPIAKLGGKKDWKEIKAFLTASGLNASAIEVNTSTGFEKVTLASKTIDPKEVKKKLKV